MLLISIAGAVYQLPDTKMKSGVNLTFSGGKILNSTNGSAQTDLMTIWQGWDKINKTDSIDPEHINLSKNWIGQMHNVTNGTADQDAVTYSQTIGAASSWNVKNYGVYGNGATDDAAALQDVIDAASALGVATGIIQDVYLPAGIYQLTAPQVTTEFFLRPRPMMHLHGAGMGQTVIRGPDNYRTAAHGSSLYFNENESLDGMQISGITFDYGEDLFDTADSIFTRIGATYCRNVLVENVEVKNASGAWCFTFGPGTDDGWSSGIVIRNCKFINSGDSKVGDETADFTCIYMSMSNASIHDNVFRNDNLMTNGTAMELHNSNQRFYNNEIDNFAYGMHIGAQKDTVSVCTGQIVQNNKIRAMVGIDYWISPTGSVWKDGVIRGNDIYIIHRNSGDLSSGIGTGLVPYGSSGYNISVTDNMVINANAPGSTYQTVGIDIKNISSGTISNNRIYNVTRGIQTQYMNGLTQFAVSGNTVQNWGYGYTNGIYTTAYCLSFDQSALGGRVVVNGNIAIGNGYPAYGIALWAHNLASVSLYDNSVMGVVTNDVNIQSGDTDTKLFIDHVSFLTDPGGYASDGSRWINAASGYDFRHTGGAWDIISYTYI